MRGLMSLVVHQDVPVLVGINPQGVYVIDNVQCVSRLLLYGVFFIRKIIIIILKLLLCYII